VQTEEKNYFLTPFKTIIANDGWKVQLFVIIEIDINNFDIYQVYDCTKGFNLGETGKF
jgi:hypothetical protein